MTEPLTDHLIDPTTITLGQRAYFQCPRCSFGYFHVWLPGDSSGSTFGDSFCFMHPKPVTMYITKVEDISSDD